MRVRTNGVPLPVLAGAGAAVGAGVTAWVFALPAGEAAGVAGLAGALAFAVALVAGRRRHPEHQADDDGQRRGPAGALRSLGVSIVVCDEAGRIVRLAGQVPVLQPAGPDLIGRELREALPGIPAEVVEDMRFAVLAGQPAGDREVVVESEGGEATLLFRYGLGEQDGGRRPSVAILDVTDRAARARSELANVRRATALLEAACVLAAEHDLEGLVAQIGRQALRLSSAATVDIECERSGGTVLSYRANRDQPGTFSSRQGQLEAPPEPARKNVLTGAPVMLPTDGRVVGWFRVRGGGTRHGETEPALRQLAELAGPLLGGTLAVDAHAQDHLATTREAQRLAVVAAAEEALLTSLELDEILSRLADVLVPAFADCCVIDLHALGLGGRRARVRLHPMLAGLVDCSGEPGPLADVALDEIADAPPDSVYRTVRPAQPFEGNAALARPTSCISAAARVQEEVIGVIHLITTAASRRRMGPEELVVSRRIAESAGRAIQHATRHDLERRVRARSEAQRARLEWLSGAGARLTSVPDLDSTLENAAATGWGLGDVCVVDLLLDDGSIRRAASTEVDEVRDLVTELAAWSDEPAAAARIGRAAGNTRVVDPADVADLLVRHEQDAELLEQLRVVFGIVVPLRGRRGPIGTLQVLTLAASSRDPEPDDTTWAAALGDRVAAALENAVLYERQRTVAGTLQHSLLPERLPSIAGLEVAARYMPAGEGIDIGGDWYDVFELPHGGAAAVVGDVVGRGVKAAAAMAQIRNALRAYLAEGHRAGEAMRLLNRFVMSKLPDQLATVVILTIDGDEVGICASGHPPPLLAYPDGSVVVLERGRGPALGVLEATFPESTLTVPPGSVLTLYTDGLVEDRSTTFDEGLRRLRNGLRQSGGSLDLLCDRIIVRGIESRTLDDDAALLAVRLTTGACPDTPPAGREEAPAVKQRPSRKSARS